MMSTLHHHHLHARIYFLEKGEAQLPRKVTTDISTTERQSVYLGGGVLFITTRILVVDFLMDRIPAHLITGLMVYR